MTDELEYNRLKEIYRQTNKCCLELERENSKLKSDIEFLEDKLYGYERTKYEVLFQFERKIHKELRLLSAVQFLNPLQETMPITEVARLVDDLLHNVCMEVIHDIVQKEMAEDFKEGDE